MPAGQLGAILHHLRRITGSADQDQDGDANLLERFRHQRDEAAFAALVKRHGPMVLRICRSTLGNIHDAEDAFQAVFLILVRKARSIRRPELLANWLFGVSQRVARKARSIRARRHQREQQGLAMDPCAFDPLIDDVGPLLLQEVERLPQQYRVPIVLCYLQGKTRREACRQLGWPEGTVAKRLSRARELLNARLTRRGILFPAAGFAALLDAATAPAALPAELALATVKAGLSLAASTTPVGALSSGAAALSEAVLQGMVVAKLKLIAVLVLAAASLLAAISFWASAGDPAARPEVPKQPDPPAIPARAVQARHIDFGDDERERTAAGQVIGANGKPVPGARVVWWGNYNRRLTDDLDRERGPNNYRPVASGRSDAKGRFFLSARFNPTDYSSFVLTAAAPGAGLAGATYTSPETPLQLTLGPEVKLEGRLHTLAGAPAEGVRVEAIGISHTRPHDRIPDWFWFLSGPGAGPEALGWPAPVYTDKEGRFTLGGFAPECVVNLELRHPRFAWRWIRVTTSDEAGEADEAVRRPRGYMAVRKGPKFAFTLEPGALLRGVVTAEDTGRPLGGVIVRIGRQSPTVFGSVARTDSRGHYEFTGIARDHPPFSVNLFPTAESGYLPASDAAAPRRINSDTLEENVRVARGRVVRGQVLDVESRLPIPGVAVNLQSKRPPMDLAVTDKTGRFVLGATPAEYRLLAHSARDYTCPLVKLSEVSNSTRGFGALNVPNGTLRVVVPADHDPPPVELLLRKGVSIEVQAVRPDGKPVPQVRFASPDTGVRFINVLNDRSIANHGFVRLRGCAPGRVYRVFLYEPETQLGAAAELRHDPHAQGPVQVRLQPTATLRGRLVREDGSPVRSANVWPNLVGSGAAQEFRIQDAWEWEATGLLFRHRALDPNRKTLYVQPDADGSFLCSGLLAGTPIYLRFDSDETAPSHRIVTLKPGETRDLGTITMPKFK